MFILCLICITIPLAIFWNWKNQQTELFKVDKGSPYIVEELPKSLVNRVGYVNTDVKLSFLKVNPQKNTQTIRIGTFGDSFTRGDESPIGMSYPDYLNHLFKEFGVQNVEIVNFGVSGASISKSYLLWKTFHQKLKLDITLWGPLSFIPERELTFTTSWQRDPRALNSRFIIHQGKLKELVIPYEDFEERYDWYQSLIPDINLIKYDLFAPAIVQALSFKRDVLNPFYHRSDHHNEAHEIQKAILKQVSSNDLTLHLNLNQEPINNLRDISNIKNSKIELISRIPFYIQGHMSPTGNYEMAKHYFNAIQTQLRLKTIETLSTLLTPSGTLNKTVTDFSLKISTYEVARLRPYGKPLLVNPFGKKDLRDFKVVMLYYQNIDSTVFLVINSKHNIDKCLKLFYKNKLLRTPLTKHFNNFYSMKLPQDFESQSINPNFSNNKNFEISFCSKKQAFSLRKSHQEVLPSILSSIPDKVFKLEALPQTGKLILSVDFDDRSHFDFKLGEYKIITHSALDKIRSPCKVKNNKLKCEK